MAERREARRDQRGRSGGSNGNANALKDGCLAAVRDAIVLDARFEVREELQFVVDGRGRLLERGEEGGDLLLHVAGCYCAKVAGFMGSGRDRWLCVCKRSVRVVLWFGLASAHSCLAAPWLL